MKSVKACKLTQEEFMPYGRYINLLNPNTARIGQKPIEFFRDMLVLPGSCPTSFSICRVEERPLVIDTIEFHSSCYEGIISLDADIIIHVGCATPNGEMPLDDLKAFVVPKGTLCILNPGVWHHAAYVINSPAANVIIALPERTYANDCYVYTLADEEKVKIDM